MPSLGPQLVVDLGRTLLRYTVHRDPPTPPTFSPARLQPSGIAKDRYSILIAKVKKYTRLRNTTQLRNTIVSEGGILGGRMPAGKQGL